MLRKITRIAVIAMAVCAAAAAARAAELNDPKEIMNQSWEYIDSLKSYSYVMWAEGWEKDLSDVQNRTKNVAGEVASKYSEKLASNAKEAPKSSSKPKKMGYHVTFKFMKPYLLQMVVTHSDYVPKIVYGSIMTFRPDKDATVFWFNPRFSPIGIKRGVDTESGTLFISTMEMEFIMMDTLGMDAKPVLKGVKQVDGADCYDVAFEFPKGKKVKEHPVDFKKWSDVPKEIHFSITKQSKGYVDKEISSVHYLFDKKNLWLRGTEEYDADGKLKYSKWYRDVTENNLNEVDF